MIDIAGILPTICSQIMLSGYMVDKWVTTIVTYIARAVLGILRIHDSIKSYIRSNTTRVREGAAVHTQLIGDSPSVRVTPARPFTHVGVDYNSGPL